MSQRKLVLFTGFPGYLGSYLAKQLLADPNLEILALVRDASVEHARREIERLENQHPTGRLSLVTGDLVSPDLGLWRHLDDLLPRITEIFHLATTFKIRTNPSFTHRINVVGTRNVIDLARRCPSFERLHFLSTAHVSGQHRGPFGEEDFDLQQTFRNAYEETKYLAEKEVRESRLPATIYRAGLLMGDSKTGAIPKYDGPSGVIQLLMRAPHVLSKLGHGRNEVNLVPSDWVADALHFLARREDTVGKTFHLVDPNPLTAHQLAETLENLLKMRTVDFPLPPRLVAGILDFGPINHAIGVPAQVVDYLSQDVRYTADATQALLKDSGIICPSVQDYLPAVMDYARKFEYEGVA